MPERPSPFQTLPWNIVNTIINHTITEECQISIVIRMLNKQKSPYAEYLSICRIWRQLILERMWKKYYLNISAEFNDVFSSSPAWRENCVPPPNQEALVRDVEIQVPFSSILTGSASSLLAKSKYNSVVLPFAHRLTINILNNMTDFEGDQAEAITNVFGFIKLVGSLAPATNQVRVGLSDSLRVRMQDEPALGALLSSVYGVSHHSALSLSKGGFESACILNSISELSSLSLTWSGNALLHSKLVHKNAKSLEKLSINYAHLNTVTSLFCDELGRGVVYPYMKQLTLSDRLGLVPAVLPCTANVAPFKSLTSLKLFMLYPFGDDVLFRGNSATLQYMEVVADPVFITTLNKHEVFSAGKYRNLRHLAFNQVVNDYVDTTVPTPMMAKFLSKLAGPAQTLQLDIDIDAEALLAMTAVDGQSFCNLQILKAASVHLSLFNIFSLLKAQPALTRLDCQIGGMGFELDHIAPEDLPDYVVSNYSNVGKHFQMWRTGFKSSSNYNRVSVYAMLVALVCPNFTRIESPYTSDSEYCNDVSKALRTGAFSKYAQRLGKLLELAK
ncbi:hypothetical protein GGI20_005285 [Coemansia sp. BCRC 34301]|nr:hypothetical protein GGI20_005285 [Coemansia sp. BCRC 34301]